MPARSDSRLNRSARENQQPAIQATRLRKQALPLARSCRGIARATGRVCRLRALAHGHERQCSERRKAAWPRSSSACPATAQEYDQADGGKPHPSIPCARSKPGAKPGAVPLGCGAINPSLFFSFPSGVCPGESWNSERRLTQPAPRAIGPSLSSSFPTGARPGESGIQNWRLTQSARPAPATGPWPCSSRQRALSK